MMSPWLQTASGRRFDLCDPTPEMVDFEIDIAGALARIPRFTGHVRAGPYSVAQHSVLGAGAILRETGNREAALAFVLHDAHEAYIGDIATPIAEAMEVAAGRLDGALVSHVPRAALKELKRGIDRAIYARAGLSYPPTPAVAARVKDYDVRMMMTEWLHLLGPSPVPWPIVFESAPLIESIAAIDVWDWQHAAAAWRHWLADGMAGFPEALAHLPRQQMEA